MTRVVEVAKQNMTRTGDDIAVAIIGDQELATNWYWRRDRGAWDRDVVKAVGQAPAGVFCTNVLYLEDAPYEWLHPHEFHSVFETEMLFVLRWSIEDGVDIGRCIFTREGGPNFDELAFAHIEGYTGEFRLTDETPGFTLMKQLLPA